MRLKNKSVLVTGGGSGIGKACALLFAKEGAKVVVNDLNPEFAQAVTDEIKKAGGTAASIQGDMGVTADAEKVVKFTIDTLGSLDVVVNSAGIEIVKPVTDHTEADIERLMAINVIGLFTVSKHAVIQMRKQGTGGSIVNLASVAGLIGLASLDGYCASKHAVVGLTRAMAKSLRDENIRVNCICPAFIDTAMGNRALNVWRKWDWPVDMLLGILQGRLGKPEEVANAALYLASDESIYVTGICLPTDNALSAG